MKKTALIIILFYLQSICLFASECFATAADTVYESEKTEYLEAELRSDADASGGSYIKIGNSGIITWKIAVQKEGWYSLKFRYRAAEGEKEEHIIRNGYQFAVGFRYSKDWSFFTTSTFLQDGINSISLKKSWSNIDIDYLQIFPVDLSPEIKPHRNIVYKENPRDVFFKLNKNGYELKSVSINDIAVPYEILEYKFQEDAVNIKMSKEFLNTLNLGDYEVKFNFINGFSKQSELKVLDGPAHSQLTIIAPYVEHGKSVLFILPSGKTMLVDCGKSWVRDSLLIPFLHGNNITKLDYFIITHYHDDHDAGDKGEKIKQLFKPEYFYDNRSLKSGDLLNIDGVQLKVLNSHGDGSDENTNSLSFNLKYKGFTYQDGGDTYAINQEKIMQRFPDDVHAEVFSANHHLHGSVSTEYLQKMKPSVVFIQSQEAIYARSAYMEEFKERTVQRMLDKEKFIIEELPNHEVGTIVIRVNGKEEWSYETYFDHTNKFSIPGL